MLGEKAKNLYLLNIFVLISIVFYHIFFLYSPKGGSFKERKSLIEKSGRQRRYEKEALFKERKSLIEKSGRKDDTKKRRDLKKKN